MNINIYNSALFALSLSGTHLHAKTEIAQKPPMPASEQAAAKIKNNDKLCLDSDELDALGKAIINISLEINTLSNQEEKKITNFLKTAQSKSKSKWTGDKQLLRQAELDAAEGFVSILQGLKQDITTANIVRLLTEKVTTSSDCLAKEFFIKLCINARPEDIKAYINDEKNTLIFFHRAINSSSNLYHLRFFKITNKSLDFRDDILIEEEWKALMPNKSNRMPIKKMSSPNMEEAYDDGKIPPEQFHIKWRSIQLVPPIYSTFGFNVYDANKQAISTVYYQSSLTFTKTESGDIAVLNIQFYSEPGEGRIKLTRPDKNKSFVYSYYYPSVIGGENERLTHNTIFNGVDKGTQSFGLRSKDKAGPIMVEIGSGEKELDFDWATNPFRKSK